MKIKDLIDVENRKYKWDVIKSIPEFAELKNCKQSTKWHQEGNAWNHTKLVCEAAVKYLDNCGYTFAAFPKLLMTAALFHDIGKGTTTSFVKGDWHSYGHEFESEKMTRQLLWEENIEEREIICALVKNHMVVLDVLKGKNPLQKIFNISREVKFWKLLCILKKCDLDGSIQADNESKERDYDTISQIQNITIDLNCYERMTAFRGNIEKYKPIVYDMNVWVFIGLPGSGKSTESEKLSTSAVANNPLLGSHFPKVIISRDIIRAELGYCKIGEKVVLSKEQENEVSKAFNQKMIETAKRGFDIILDNINLKREYRDAYKETLKDFNVKWNYVYVQADSLEKNIERRKGQISENVLKDMQKKLDWPDFCEYDTLSILTN